MGRRSTGVYEVMECTRIELSTLLKYKILVKGHKTETDFSWKDGSEILLQTCYKEDEKYIRLIYGFTREGGEKVNRDYKVYIDTVPSNLGKGEVLYFICPKQRIRCRVLYNAYGSHLWLSRKFYESIGLRIYYPSQARSKNNYEFNRRNHYKKKIDDYRDKKNKHRTHKGKLTKDYTRYLKDSLEYEYWFHKCNEQALKYLGYRL
jgi:hypothetical protein